MKTTLNIDDSVFAELKRAALREERTMSELVEAGVRLLLEREEEPKELPTLPKFSLGNPTVDISNRDELYEAMRDY